jgi:integrase
VASILQTGPTSWRALIRRKGSKSLCRTFRTRREAERWARHAEADLEAGRTVHAPGGATVGDAIDAYRALRDSGQRPIAPSANEHYMLEHLVRDLGDTPVAGLTPQRLAAFARRRADAGAGPYTVGMEVSKLRTALRYAAISLSGAWGDPVGAAKPLLEHLGLVGPGRPRDRRPTPDELAALRAAVPALMRDIIDFAVGSCLRRGEIARLGWADLDTEKRLALIRDRKHPRRKTGNDEWIPLLGEAWDIVQRQPRGDDRVFPVAPEWMSDTFLLGCRVAGIADLHLHDLRHEGISRLFEGGMSIEQVALVSGHRSWSQLRCYTQLKPESLHSRACGPGTLPRP